MTVPVLAVVQLSSRSGLPADRVDMDFSFLAADTSGGTLDGIEASLESFFNTTSTQSHPLAGYIGDPMTRSSVSKINFYDLTGHLDGSPHGSPIATYDWTLTGSVVGTNFPAEVCVALSFHGDLSGIPETSVNPDYPPTPPKFFRPAARRRGRVYFGPTSGGAFSANTNGYLEVGSTFMADVTIAVARFMDERPDFAVWSRVDEALYLVDPDGGWSVDNAPDTQRRRGQAASARTDIWP